MLIFDIDRTARDIVQLLSERKLRVSFAESCTGGMISSAVVGVPGASGVVDANIVTYSDRAKVRYTDVTGEILSEHGAVSAECAAAMASGIRRETGSDIGVGVTGIAGPGGGSVEKPVGTVYVAVSSNGKTTVKHFLINAPDRQAVREKTAFQALILLKEIIVGF